MRTNEREGLPIDAGGAGDTTPQGPAGETATPEPAGRASNAAPAPTGRESAAIRAVEAGGDAERIEDSGEPPPGVAEHETKAGPLGAAITPGIGETAEDLMRAGGAGGSGGATVDETIAGGGVPEDSSGRPGASWEGIHERREQKWRLARGNTERETQNAALARALGSR